MATISGATNERVYSIPKWLGLNEHPDGDTRLKLGEASKMVNWKITRDGNLKRRPGQEFFAGLSERYIIHISDNVTAIKTGMKATDEVPLYTDATAMAPPGTITLIGTSGVVQNGVYTVSGAEVANGTLSGSEDMEYVVQNGILRPAGFSDRVTIETLSEILSELGDGEYLYTKIGEMPYALRRDSVDYSNGTYTLGGYQMSAIVDGSTAKPVAGLWSGIAGGKRVLLAACDGKLWSLYDEDTDAVIRVGIGNINTDKGVTFIPFNNKVYVLNGYEYYEYDGSNVTPVEGYRPLVATAIGPQGTADAGELTGEYVNRLNGKRRVWISPDGTGTVFQLPEPANAIDFVQGLGTEVTVPGYVFNPGDNFITFNSAPARAVNAIEIGYSVTDSYRSDVTGMLFCELYSGATDSMLCLYGDGTNKVIYSGIDYDGMPRPDYFPDQYEFLVGDANTPVTSVIRHYAALMCYKPNECWAASTGITTLATGDATVSFTVTPVNRDKGHASPGQVRLVNNNPVTGSGTELYQWINSSYYTSALSRDERQARRISDRVQESVKEIDLAHCCMWDDNDGQEFYVCDTTHDVTLVWNYALDVWYRYAGLDAVIMCNFQGDVIVGTSGGKIFRLTYERETDDGVKIDAYWESGAMDFGASHMRKYSSMMWVGLKPESGTSVDVTVITDRKNTFHDKVVSSEKAKVPGQSFMTRTKIKAKKFVFYKLILKVLDKMPAVTVTNVDFRVRQTGYSK